jgi:flagellar biosynthetic protein FliR
MSLLEAFIQLQITAFILTFVRVGTAIMLMPGVGDSFVPANIRLYFALALSLVLMPMVTPLLPTPLPAGPVLIALVFTEFLVGALIGTVARIFMSITDTAGMIVSFQAGLSNAMLFNPAMAGQGSLMGAFFSVTAATLLFSLNLHHIMILGLLESYDRFAVAAAPDFSSMAQVVTHSIAAAFFIAAKMAAPFLILIMVLYAAMGVLSKLMPTLQIFILAMPVQILLSLLILTLVVGAMLLYFADQYRTHVGQFLGG